MRKSPRLLCGLVVAFLLASIVPASAQYPNPEPNRNVAGPTSGWEKLAKLGPGHSGVVTLGDGTLRGGWIAGVDATQLQLQSAGKTFDIAASDIATVRIKRSDRTLLYGVIGYLVTATAATVIAYNDDNHEFKDLTIVFGVAGIPGALLGAVIGERTSGDVEIVP